MFLSSMINRLAVRVPSVKKIRLPLPFSVADCFDVHEKSNGSGVKEIQRLFRKYVSRALAENPGCLMDDVIGFGISGGMHAASSNGYIMRGCQPTFFGKVEYLCDLPV